MNCRRFAFGHGCPKVGHDVTKRIVTLDRISAQIGQRDFASVQCCKGSKIGRCGCITLDRVGAACDGCAIDFDAVHIEGIRDIAAGDIAYATELGYRIKLLGIAEKTDSGIGQRVHPVMVPVDAPIAAVEGVVNGVVAEGDFVGTTMFEGPGAGGGPTASAVVADIIDIARGRTAPAFGVPVAAQTKMQVLPMSERTGLYYIRVIVHDRPGVFADIATALGECEISIESAIQRSRAEGGAVPLVLTTHRTKEAAMRVALDRIAALDSVVEPPQMIRIETF